MVLDSSEGRTSESYITQRDSEHPSRTEVQQQGQGPIQDMLYDTYDPSHMIHFIIVSEICSVKAFRLVSSLQPPAGAVFHCTIKKSCGSCCRTEPRVGRRTAAAAMTLRAPPRTVS